MNRYVPIIFSAVLLLMAFPPCQVLAASITETKAAIGEGCTASGNNSTAMGFYTIASGVVSTTMGSQTAASGNYSTAMGSHTIASGLYSTAMGSQTVASGNYSIAMGWGTTAGGHYSFAGGGRSMRLEDVADHTFVWGDSLGAQLITAANAFLIFPAGTAGKVGIGTKSPQNLLDLGESKGKKLAVFQKTTGTDFYGFGISGNTLEFYAGAAASASPAMVVKKTTGRVGIGTSDPSYKLHVNGTAAGTSWTNLSSRDFKKDIRKVDDTAYPLMLAKVMKMELTTYKYKEEYGGGDGVKLGFIAEDLPEEVLSKHGKGVDLYELLTLTIGAMKAQNKEIEVQKLENRTLKAKVSELFRRIDALEK